MGFSVHTLGVCMCVCVLQSVAAGLPMTPPWASSNCRYVPLVCAGMFWRFLVNYFEYVLSLSPMTFATPLKPAASCKAQLPLPTLRGRFLLTS